MESVSDKMDAIVRKNDEEMHNEILENAKEQQRKYKKILLYDSMKWRIELLKKLNDANKIKLSPEAIDEINEWLVAYKQQGVFEAEKQFLISGGTIPEISLPEFPVRPDDIFYPKSNPFVLEEFKKLLEYTNLNDNIEYNTLELFLRQTITEDDELVSVSEAEDMEKGRRM